MFSISRESGRAEYFIIFVVSCCLLNVAQHYVNKYSKLDQTVGILILIFVIILFFTCTARRFLDIDQPAGWAFLLIIPPINLIVIALLLFYPTVEKKQSVS